MLQFYRRHHHHSHDDWSNYVEVFERLVGNLYSSEFVINHDLKPPIFEPDRLMELELVVNHMLFVRLYVLC